MPSEPDSGPTMKSTLSCSISLRAWRIVVSGVVSVAATTVSILAGDDVVEVPVRSASSTLRTPSLPPSAVEAFDATRIPILIVSSANAGLPGEDGADRHRSREKSLHLFLPKHPGVAPAAREMTASG